jgi:epoxyqueuosine reductase
MKKRIHYNPKLTTRARELRNNSRLSEVLLWQELKSNKMLGYDFQRQKPIDTFIVDFFCCELMLAIEIDGGSHDGKEKYDSFRQQKLESLGVRFLRFDDLDVKQKIDWVREEIQAWINSNSSFREKIESTTTNSSDPIISSEFPPSKGSQAGVDRNAQSNTHFIKAIATQLGFSFCGISKAEFLSEEAPKLEEWLKRGYQGKMSYLENHFDKRLDPRLLVPGAKSVVCLAYNYFPKKDLAKESDLKLAKYAYGEDYHHVVKEKLKEFIHIIQTEIGEVNGRAFVDSAPVHERAWAAKSGLGWIGKNSLLLNRQIGSFFFLAELVLDLELEPDGPIKDYCGTCTACMDACPTDAIPQPYVVDGSKCISYFTIELKEEIPTEVKGKFENWIFGCDICQDVCPWNRFSKPHNEKKFEPHPDLGKMTKADWQEITEDVFEKLFKKSAVKRTKLAGLKRNIQFVLK